MPLVVSVLGPFQATYDGQPLAFATDAARALLAYLAIEGDRPHSRAQLAALLWPEQSQQAAYANLRQTLARLRKALPEPAVALLLVTTQTLQLVRGEITTDQTRFEALLAECAAHAHPQLLNCPDCAKRLREAAEHYRGDLLHGLELKESQPFEEWLLVRREALHRQALDALDTLTRQAEAAGAYAQMREYAARQLALEPWREEAHTQLMLALAYSGQRTAALAQYETCRHILDQELGIEPEVATQLLYARIRAGTLVPARLGAQLPAQNLPAQLTPFIGRERELAEIAEYVQRPEIRLLTLIGAGGMGKTRLAIETARARLDNFPDGVFFVALAPLTAASAIAATIATTIGVSVGGDPEQALLHALRDTHMLLVLDNLEHLLDGIPLIVALLQAAPHVQILATSREPLNLRGEQLYRVQPMEDAAGTTLADAGSSSALRLFAQSARRAKPDWAISAANLSAVQQICALVHGIPLGLELAAAWAGSLELDEIALEIMHSADFLASEWRDAPERQRSMRAVFDWSWRLLDATERAVFRQLAVFRGGFTRAAAEAVVGASLQVLTRLMHKSLLRRGATGRYEVHELLRQFAAEQLAIEPEEQAAAHHSAYYLAFLGQRELRLARDEPHEAAAEIQGEIDNIRNAWMWAAAHTRVEELDCSVYGLWQFYTLTGLSLEGEQAFSLAAERLHQPKGTVGPEQAMRNRHRLLSKLLAAQAHFMNLQSKYDQGIPVARQAIALGYASGQHTGEAMGYVAWGLALFRKGQCSDARPHFERAIELARSYQSGGLDSEPLREVEWDALVWLGILEEDEGDYDAGRAHLMRALHICRILGKRSGECRCLNNIGEIAMIVGDYSAAAGYFQEGLRIARQCGDRSREGIAQMALGIVALAQRNYALARDSTASALGIFRDIDDRTFEAYTLAYIGRLADSVGDYARAHAELDRSLRLSQEVGSWEAQFYAYVFLALLQHHTGDNGLACHYAEQGQQIAIQAGDRSRQAEAWVALGRAHEGLQQLAAAFNDYRQALALYDQLGRVHMATEAHAGLARIALAQGDEIQALSHIEGIVGFLETQPLVGPEEPLRVYLTCCRVLQATNDARAVGVLRMAQRMLHAYADSIADAAQRRSFLENVAAQRMLLESDTLRDAVARPSISA